ncbi:MAG: 30S ribosomal protein S20 [Candidatus Omnitrophica bacterium]|nr:30S ribosomal protein S20 [Candidatus Omnitrophota bacterium]
MPLHTAAYKAIRSDAKKRKRNEAIKSELKTIVKKIDGLIAQAKKDEARNYLKLVSAKFMRAASKNIIHKKNASRKISRLAKKINKIK